MTPRRHGGAFVFFPWRLNRIAIAHYFALFRGKLSHLRHQPVIDTAKRSRRRLAAPSSAAGKLNPCAAAPEGNATFIIAHQGFRSQVPATLCCEHGRLPRPGADCEQGCASMSNCTTPAIRPARRTRRVFAALAVVFLAVWQATPGAAQDESTETPKHGGVLVYAVDAEPPNYDCYANYSFVFLHVMAPLYSTLLKFDTANYPAIVGDLAQSWTVSRDGDTYSFKLRHNVLFHDGTPLTSADVKASYERLIHPPPGAISVRKVNYAAIKAIDTPDPYTVVFHLSWPDAAMLANFASPWNCIYSAAKLRDDPNYPKSEILGTGPFVFAGRTKGKDWTGKRWNKYFIPGKPYLDGYRVEFIRGPAVVKAMEEGRIMAQFRSFTPAERDELVGALGDKVVVHEGPWITNLLVVFNTKQPPFNDARVRRALSLGIDRWDAAQALSRTTFLKFVGGLMRPGTAMATSETDLVTLPGFSHDAEASRAEARQLLAEAGATHLAFRLTNRNDVPVPYGPAAQYLIAAWRKIGVEVTENALPTKEWQNDLQAGNFTVALDLAADYFDDPTVQLTRYVSHDISPLDHSEATDRFLDALYVGQAVNGNARERTAIVGAFERHALNQANSVPFLWWNRIIVAASAMKGWHMSPSHYIGQDLADVWLDR